MHGWGSIVGVENAVMCDVGMYGGRICCNGKCFEGDRACTSFSFLMTRVDNEEYQSIRSQRGSVATREESFKFSTIETHPRLPSLASRPCKITLYTHRGRCVNKAAKKCSDKPFVET